MSVFDVKSDTFEDRFSFNSYLTQNYSSLTNDDLYVISGVTEYDRGEFQETLQGKGWEFLEDYGAIQKIALSYSEEHTAEAYLSFDDDYNLVFFYTDQRKTEEIENAIEPFLHNTRGVHYLYISPRILKETREKIVEKETGAKITEFVAKRTERTEVPAEYRPDINRTVNYYGDDGLERLRSWERDLGVLPHIMQIQIPDKIQFRIDKEGVFKLQSGSLTSLFEYVEDCIQRSLEIAEAYKNTDFRMLEVSDDFKVPRSVPATIELKNELEYHEIEKVEDNIEDNKYVVLDSFAEEGSLFFSGKVYDETHNLFFNLRANTDEIRIFPEDESDIGSFYRFFEFVQTTVDERASLKVADT